MSLRLVASLAVATAIAACSRSAPGVDGTPLVVAVPPTHAPADRMALERALSTAAGTPVTVRVLPSQQALMALAGSHQADAFLTPLFDYLFCAHEYGAHAVLQAVRAGGTRDYAGAIVVRRAAPVASLAALAGQRVAFVDRYSTSGFILPTRLLILAGADVEPVFAGSPEAAVAELRAGTVAAAAVRSGLVANADDLFVLAVTEPIPNEPVWVRPDLPQDARDRLVRAFESLATTPDGRAALAGVADIAAFAPVSPDAFHDVHEAVEQIGKRVADLVPGGWWLHHQNAVHPGDLGPY